MGQAWDGHGTGMGQVWDGHGTVMGQLRDGTGRGARQLLFVNNLEKSFQIILLFVVKKLRFYRLRGFDDISNKDKRCIARHSMIRIKIPF